MCCNYSACALEPVLCNKRSHHNKKSMHHNLSGPCWLLKEEIDRTGSILKAGLHLGPDCELLSYMPSIYGNYIPTGKPGPQKEEPQGSYLGSPSLKEYPNYLCNQIESYILLIGV